MAMNINTPKVAAQIDAAMEIKNTGDAAKAQIAANRAAQALAQQAAEPQLTPPTGDPSKVSAPVITNLSFEDMMRERFAREYAEEKRKEQARIEMSRNGTGIAGIAATIGDMVRASEGAPVQQRDWQRIYDNLTAQEKANINNYQVRMAKLREDARADRKAAAAAAAGAEAKKQQRDYEVVKDYIERNFKGDQAEKDRMLKYLLGIEQNKARVDAAKSRVRGGSPKSASNIRAFGNTHFIDASQYNATMDGVYNMLENMGVVFGIKPEIVGVDRTTEKIARAGQALESAVLDPSQKDDKGRSMWKISYLGAPTYITEDQKNEIEGYIQRIANHRASTSSGSVYVYGEGGTDLDTADKWFK